MSLVNITNIQYENNPDSFLSPIKMNITFECLEEITEEDVIDWELIYIGSAKDDKKDILLDKFSMGPLEKGIMQFTIESEPPDWKKIPSKEDLLNITAIILGVSYKKQEFFRVGYYVYNCYTDPELIENDPPIVQIDKVQRSILDDKPRITRFQINWDDNQSVNQFQSSQNETQFKSMFGENFDQSLIMNEIQNNTNNANSINFQQFESSQNFNNVQKNENNQEKNEIQQQQTKELDDDENIL